jgi:hypothetical protein
MSLCYDKLLEKQGQLLADVNFAWTSETRVEDKMKCVMTKRVLSREQLYRNYAAGCRQRHLWDECKCDPAILWCADVSALRCGTSFYILLGLGECRGGAGKRLSIGDLAA